MASYGRYEDADGYLVLTSNGGLRIAQWHPSPLAPLNWTHVHTSAHVSTSVGPPCRCLSFNGGKDCVVLLDLLAGVLGREKLHQVYTFTFEEPHPAVCQQGRFISYYVC